MEQKVWSPQGFQIGSTIREQKPDGKGQEGEEINPSPAPAHPADMRGAEWATGDDGSWFQLPHTHGSLAW
jgi:hypothetical protein